MLYALDSSILIFLFRKDESVLKILEKKTKEKNKISIPPITYYETLRGLIDNNANKKIAEVKQFYDISFFPDISERKVMEKAAEIYIKQKKAGLAVGNNDILIAAWCIIANAVLVTDNIKHFNGIQNLKIENWKDR